MISSRIVQEFCGIVVPVVGLGTRRCHNSKSLRIRTYTLRAHGGTAALQTGGIATQLKIAAFWRSVD